MFPSASVVHHPTTSDSALVRQSQVGVASHSGSMGGARVLVAEHVAELGVLDADLADAAGLPLAGERRRRHRSAILAANLGRVVVVSARSAVSGHAALLGLLGLAVVHELRSELDEPQPMKKAGGEQDAGHGDVLKHVRNLWRQSAADP